MHRVCIVCIGYDSILFISYVLLLFIYMYINSLCYTMLTLIYDTLP